MTKSLNPTERANLTEKFRAAGLKRRLSRETDKGGITMRGINVGLLNRLSRERSLSGDIQDNALMHYRMMFLSVRIANLSVATKKDDKPGQFKLKMLQNGVITQDEQLNFLTWQHSHPYDSKPVPDEEIASYNNFFALHPEKVAGIETMTSSLMFPVTIKGKRADIDRIFSFLNKPYWSASKDDDLFDLELEAEALEIELLLLKY